MRYISTRGQAPALDFNDVVLAGLASDGGLYVPESIPHFAPHEIAALAGLHYTELAYRIIAPFVGEAIASSALQTLIVETYSDFRHSAVAPLKQLDYQTWVLELFHGPTLAFKDFALQCLGRLLDMILRQRNQSAVILGATSGDTGSAAIAGCAGRGNMQMFILHPHGRTSEVQRRQMTTVDDPNVHNFAVEGTFDDCQDIVKALFNDPVFRARHHLTAVNSINWARIVAQIVYYFYAALQLGAPGRAVSFSVPTGNFGDIYAGYIAKRMGLPIDQLVIATNQNDIMARCLHTGIYRMQGVEPTLSPSMDIQISSNFERLLFELYDGDGATIQQLMQDLRSNGSFTLSPQAHTRFRRDFTAAMVDDTKTKATMRRVAMESGELLDPHTAVGLAAAETCRKLGSTPMIVLATAHPAKFPQAVEQAVGITPALPPHLQDIFERQERFTVLPNSASAVMAALETALDGDAKR